MKNILFIFTLLCLLFLGSCEKNLLSPSGVVSFYGGDTGSNISSLDYKSQSVTGPTKESYIYVKKIEISTTGSEWVELLSESEGIEVKVTDIPGVNGIVKIGSPVSIPAGEYHGVRLTIEPKVRFVEIYTQYSTITSSIDVTLEIMPSEMQYGNGGTAFAPTDTILFTSANGYLVPFDIAEGTETFILFRFYVGWKGNSADDITDWSLTAAARATRFLY